MKRLKIAGIVLFAVIIVNLAFILFMHHRNEVYRREWFKKWSEQMDATMKSNGLVNVGGNTWELPDKRSTNTSGTNSISN